MKVVLFVLSTVLYSTTVRSQPLMTRTGFIGFYSNTLLEDIRAESRQTYAIIDTLKKDLAFAVLLKGFIFQRQLMQEHFNENYVESDRFPKATFSGTYSIAGVPDKAGGIPVIVKGNLTLHGVTNPVQTTAVFLRRPGTLEGRSTFYVKPEDYQISIPSVVRDKISNELKIQVDVAWVTK